MPPEIDVQADGALRIITLNRPDSLNAVNDALHAGLAQLWTRLSEDREARAAVLTGAGRAFSAGGDFAYLEELRQDPDLRAKTIAHGREIVLGMARCRIPVVAAVNGPAVGLGCSLVALSDIVYITENAYLADPHVQVGLVAADGGPLTWPLQMSLLQAKEYALTGARISAQRAAEIGLANHVVEDPMAEALACAKKTHGAAAAGRREHQAAAEHSPRARGSGQSRLCQRRRGSVVPDGGLPQHRHPPQRQEVTRLICASRRKSPRHQRKGFLSRGWVTPARSSALRSSSNGLMGARQRAIEFVEEWAGPAQGVVRGGPLTPSGAWPQTYFGWIG